MLADLDPLILAGHLPVPRLRGTAEVRPWFCSGTVHGSGSAASGNGVSGQSSAAPAWSARSA